MRLQHRVAFSLPGRTFWSACNSRAVAAAFASSGACQWCPPCAALLLPRFLIIGAAFDSGKVPALNRLAVSEAFPNKSRLREILGRLS